MKKKKNIIKLFYENENEINEELIDEENDYQINEINIMELIVEIFKKPSTLRNKDELFFIENYLVTFENVMRIFHQKKIGSE